MNRTALILAAVLAVSSRTADADPKPRPVKTADYVKAEVRGTLRFDPGYFVSIRSSDDPKAETRVWLWIGENKILVRQFEGLTGKVVVVKGTLYQQPANVGAIVPPRGLYFKEGEFTVEAAKPPAP